MILARFIFWLGSLGLLFYSLWTFDANLLTEATTTGQGYLPLLGLVVWCTFWSLYFYQTKK